MLNTSYKSCGLNNNKCFFNSSECWEDDCPIMEISRYVNKHTEILCNLANEMMVGMQAMADLSDVVKEMNSDMGEIIDEFQKRGE